MGFEDDRELTTDELIEQAKRVEVEKQLKQAETIQKMEQNRIEEEQKQAKLKKQIELISEVVKQSNEPLIQDLRDQRGQIDEIKQLLGQMLTPQQPQPAQPNATTANQPMDLNSLPMDMKVGMLSNALDGISKVIAAWKMGNTPAVQPADNYFNELSKQIVTNMLQAGVDGIMRNVYDNYNPIPPKQPRIAAPTQPAPPSHNLE